jgi:hypothetical protein
MRRVVLATFVLTLGFVAAVDAAPTTRFKNCTELRSKYPKGVALTKTAAAKSGAKYSPAVYRANASMDRDKDKAACES